jgi:hypothetical protein
MANKIQVTVSVDITNIIDNACEASQQTYVNSHQGVLPHYMHSFSV